MQIDYNRLEIDFFAEKYLYSFNRIITEIKKNRVPYFKTCEDFFDDIIPQIQQILLLLQENNIVHNDIKHDNIMFDNYLQAHFIDFGIGFIKCKNVYNLNHNKAARYISPPEVVFSMVPNMDKSFIDLYALGVFGINCYTNYAMYEIKGEEGKVSYAQFLTNFYGPRIKEQCLKNTRVDWESSAASELESERVSKCFKEIKNVEIKKIINQCLQPNPKFRFFTNSYHQNQNKNNKDSDTSSEEWISNGKLFANMWHEIKNLECYDMKSHTLAPFLAMEMYCYLFYKKKIILNPDEEKEWVIACLYVAVSIYASSLYFMDYCIPLGIRLKMLQAMEHTSSVISEMEDSSVIRKFIESYPEHLPRPLVSYILLFPILRKYPQDFKTLEYLITERLDLDSKLDSDSDSDSDLNLIKESLEKRWIPLFYSENYQLQIFIPWSRFFPSFPPSLLTDKFLKIKN